MGKKKDCVVQEGAGKASGGTGAKRKGTRVVATGTVAKVGSDGVVEIARKKRKDGRVGTKRSGKVRGRRPKSGKEEGSVMRDDLVVYGDQAPQGETVTEMLRLRGEGLPLRMICARYGVSRARMEKWMSQGEEDLDEGKNTDFARLYVGMARAETAVAERCMNGILDAGLMEGGRNWQALAWIMERCFPEEYGMARRADVGEKSSPVRVVLGAGGEKPVSEPMSLAGVVDVPVVEDVTEPDAVDVEMEEDA